MWAHEFDKRFLVLDRTDGTTMDQGLMIAWIANAIETAKGIERLRIQHADRKREWNDRPVTHTKNLATIRGMRPLQGLRVLNEETHDGRV